MGGFEPAQQALVRVHHPPRHLVGRDTPFKVTEPRSGAHKPVSDQMTGSAVITTGLPSARPGVPRDSRFPRPALFSSPVGALGEEDGLVGETLNLAARLQAAADTKCRGDYGRNPSSGRRPVCVRWIWVPSP